MMEDLITTLSPQGMQDKYWIFTEEEIFSCRNLANSRAETKAALIDIDMNDNEDNETLPTHFSSTTTIYTTPKWPDESSIKLETISTNEKQILKQEEYVLRHFCRQIQICLSTEDSRHFGIASREHKYWRVCATTIIYFRRFYLNNRLCIHDPRVIMLGCIMLASKIEEARVERLDELLPLNPKATENELLQAELLVIQSLNFQTKVFHPQNVVHSLIADMKRKMMGSSSKNVSVHQHSESKGVSTTVQSAMFQTWLPAAQEVLLTLQLTNAVLQYTPLQIAFTALYITENAATTAASSGNDNNNSSIKEVRVKKEVVSVTIGTSEGDGEGKGGSGRDKGKGNSIEDNTVHRHRSALLTYFVQQFGQEYTNTYKNSVANITALLEEGQNCRERQEVIAVRGAMKKLKQTAQWNIKIKDEDEVYGHDEGEEKEAKPAVKAKAKAKAAVRGRNDPPLVSEGPGAGPARKRVKKE